MAEGELQAHGHGFNRHWFAKKEKAVEYQCCYCRNILEDPLQITVCGHQFCKLCLPPKVKKCPTCHADFTKDQVFHDKSAQQKILALVIKCPCKGCNWKGLLSDFQEIKIGGKKGFHKKGIALEKTEHPRSYRVQTPNGLYRRNRRHLLKVEEPTTEHFEMEDVPADKPM